MAILLSEHLNVSAEALNKQGVFDMVIGIDTKLFVDPLSLKNCSIVEFKNSRKKIVSYFEKIITLIMHFPNPRAFNLAVKMLTFPEPKGVSIGYGSDNDHGNAIGPKLARRLAKSGREIYEMGIIDPEIFELLGLFEEDFGGDRLSDMTIDIILFDFFKYTERICKKLSIDCNFEITLHGVIFNLPKHPDKKEYLIFIPEKFLRKLPVASSWEEVCFVAEHNQELRSRLNKMLAGIFTGNAKKVTKKDIRRLIFSEKVNIDELLSVYKELNPKSYDFLGDFLGHGKWYQNGKSIFEKYKDIEEIKKPENLEELDDFVKSIVGQYKRAIEETGGNKILYAFEKGKFHPFREEICQLVFLIVAEQNCKINNVFLSRESNYGHGPVDFSLGVGYKEKIIIEIKKSSNSNIIHGYRAQLADYEKSEHSGKSYYIVLIIGNNNKKIDELISIKKKLDEDGIKAPEIVLIDGRIKPSPSNLR
jgi:hypothetical protein